MSELSPRRRRVRDAFDHREPDRVPLFEQSVASDVASEILGREAFTGTTYLHYQEADAWMRGEGAHREFEERLRRDTVAIARALRFDMLSAPWRMTACPALRPDDNTFVYGDPAGDHEVYRFDPGAKSFGCRERVRATARAGELGRLEADVEILEELAARYGTADALEDLAEQRRLLAEHGAEFEVLGTGFIQIPLEEEWLVACALRPDIVERRLDAALAIEEKKLQAQADLGIRVIWGGGDFADKNGPVFGPAVFRHLLLPRIRRMAARATELGLWYLFRTDGNLVPIAADFFGSGIAGYGEIDYEAGMRLTWLKPHYGGRITFWGNLPCGTTLYAGSPPEVADQVRRMIDTGAPGGGYVFGSSNAILPNTPVANVLAMYETAWEHGRY